MEQLNRIEIRGNVGNILVNTVGGKRVAHISVATSYVYKGSNGEANIDTTWHNVTAWEGSKGIADFDQIKVGFPVYVTGRVRMQRYMSKEGVEKTGYDIIASQLEMIDDRVSTQIG